VQTNADTDEDKAVSLLCWHMGLHLNCTLRGTK